MVFELNFFRISDGLIRKKFSEILENVVGLLKVCVPQIDVGINSLFCPLLFTTRFHEENFKGEQS